MRCRKLLAAIFVTLTLLGFASLATAQGTLPGNQVVTAAEVATAIRSTPNATPWMRTHADEIGALAMFESGGNTTIYNGSCCYGVLQMNTRNIARYADVTAAEFRRWPMEAQVDAWAKLTAEGLQGSAPRQLIAAGSFDGRPVDFALVISCVQLGIGNCQTMVSSGSCGGFRDSNGTSICDMADRINAGTGGSPVTAPPTEPGSPGSSSPIHYGPIDCATSAGGCMSMSEALRAGFESGSGVSMDQLRTLIQLLLVATALAVMGNAMVGVWRGYAKGRMTVADLSHYMLRAVIVVLAVVIILTVT